MPDCPHNPDWLKHFAADNRVQCQRCGDVWVSPVWVKRQLDRLKHNMARQIGDVLTARDEKEADNAKTVLTYSR